jgi:hypothetical protein
LVAPVSQLTVPLGAVATSSIMQMLVGELSGSGTASGAPNRQPALVQFRLLPVWVDVVPPTVTTSAAHATTPVTEAPRSGTAKGSGYELPPPPMYKPPQARFVTVGAPPTVMMSPQSPGVSALMKLIAIALPQQAVEMVVEDVLLVDEVDEVDDVDEVDEVDDVDEVDEVDVDDVGSLLVVLEVDEVDDVDVVSWTGQPLGAGASLRMKMPV